MLSLPFNQVMRELIDFIDQESTTTSDEAAATTMIIGHGALLTDFPLLIANCIKNSFDYTPFTPVWNPCVGVLAYWRESASPKRLGVRWGKLLCSCWRNQVLGLAHDYNIPCLRNA